MSLGIGGVGTLGRVLGTGRIPNSDIQGWGVLGARAVSHMHRSIAYSRKGCKPPDVADMCSMMRLECMLQRCEFWGGVYLMWVV